MNPIIRFAELRDAPAIREIYAPYVLETPVSFEEVVPTEEEMVARIEAVRDRLPYLVCETDGIIAGYAYASDYRTRSAYRWTKELSVYVRIEYHRHKIGWALYHCLVRMLRIQGVKLLLAGITIPNSESVGFHEKFGFSKAAEYLANGFKQGKWHNVGWWQMVLNPSDEAPAPQIIPVSEIPEINLSAIFLEGIKLISL